jgi:hypothetical protein
LRGEAFPFRRFEAAVGGAEQLSRAVHDLAWFWKVWPDVVWNTRIDRVAEALRQTERIGNKVAAAVAAQQG